MFKFELNQVIYYIRDNRIHSAPVLARMIVENAHDDWTSTQEQKDFFTPFGANREVYATCHGLFYENVFGSKQDLVDFLRRGAAAAYF